MPSCFKNLLMYMKKLQPIPIVVILILFTLQPTWGQNDGCQTQVDESLKIKRHEKVTTIYSGKSPLVTYVHAETPSPEGVDPIFHRSAYIHPLYSPGGQVLTRIQPDDHYHHYGIWNPWTRTRIGDKGVDFWNLGAGMGRVRFASYPDPAPGEGDRGFVAAHEHIYYLDDGSEKVAINETWDVQVTQVLKDAYVLDMVVTLNCPLKGGILFEAYRYGGGLGFRATEKWGTDNSTVLTSEGKTREDADGSTAKWVRIEGASSVPQGRSGILFLSHPDNRSHPEPMRMWPPDQYDRKANLFFEFCPIRHTEWKLEQGKDYVLKYRMVVFDGSLGKKAAENYWQEFADSSAD